MEIKKNLAENYLLIHLVLNFYQRDLYQEVIIINQSSKINNWNVSRGTGIRVSKKGEIHPNKYDDTFEKEEEELVNIILKYPLFFQFIVDNAKTTPLRSDKKGNKFHASFLHDVVNALFA